MIITYNTFQAWHFGRLSMERSGHWWGESRCHSSPAAEWQKWQFHLIQWQKWQMRDKLTNMILLSHPLTKWQKRRMTNAQYQYTDPEVGFWGWGWILWLNLSTTLECIVALYAAMTSTLGTHQLLMSIAWAIFRTVEVWGWDVWTSCIWDSFLPGFITRMCLHLFAHLFILFCIDLIWFRPEGNTEKKLFLISLLFWLCSMMRVGFSSVGLLQNSERSPRPYCTQQLVRGANWSYFACIFLIYI